MTPIMNVVRVALPTFTICDTSPYLANERSYIPQSVFTQND